MVDIRFDLLFKVELNHSYYQSGKTEDFHIKPTRECQRLLRDYGLLFKTIPSGFVVLYEYRLDELDNKEILKSLDEDLMFSFILQSGNRYLENYSDLPLEDQEASVYNPSNLNDNQQGDDLLLTADTGSEFLSQEDLFPLKSQQFRYQFENGADSVQVRVQNVFGESVIDESVSPVDNLYDMLIDLRDNNPGRYVLLIDGNPELTFYASDELQWEPVFGVIDIFQSADVPNDYRFIDNAGNVAMQEYKVKLNQRETFWKYFVVLKYQTDLDPEDLSISKTGNSLTFQREPQITLSDGSVAVPFISTTAIRLQEDPLKGIRLEKQHGGPGDRLEVENLPNASISSLTPNSVEDKIYSEIYVYI